MYIEMEKLFPVRLPVVRDFNDIRESHLNTQLINNDSLKHDIEEFKYVFKKYQLDKFKKTKSKIANEFVSIMKESLIQEELNNMYEVVPELEQTQSKNKSRNQIVNFLTNNDSNDYYFIHIDVISGNFNAYKVLLRHILKEEVLNDPITQLFENNNVYIGFINDFVNKHMDLNDEEKEIFEVIKHSKSYRQVLFGNLNPKKVDIFLSFMIDKVKKELFSYFKESDRTEIVSSSQDEITVAIHKDDITREDFLTLLDLDFNLPVRIEEHSFELIEEIKSNTKLDAKKYYIENNIGSNGVINSRTLKGVPKNLYIPMYKKYILGQELEDIDLYNQVDGNIFQLVLFS